MSGLLHVPVQPRRHHECLPALVATERLLTGVPSHVHLQIPIGDESLLAEFARIRLLSGVRSLVNFEVVLHPEALGANFTMEGLEILVDVFVLPEGLLR